MHASQHFRPYLQLYMDDILILKHHYCLKSKGPQPARIPLSNCLSDL